MRPHLLVVPSSGGQNAFVEPVPAKRDVRIWEIRGHNVLLDEDLAEMYGVEVKVLNQAVKRNADRFPPDFMFQLTREEAGSLRSQIVTSKVGRGGRRYLPLARIGTWRDDWTS